MKKMILNIWHSYKIGNTLLHDKYFLGTRNATREEINKKPRRTEIINYFLSFSHSKCYLEIGVRNPAKNFDRIRADTKYSVDPGIEFTDNPVDFKMTSDLFFKKLENGELVIAPDFNFDVVFIDGLHLADQVERDIENALKYLSKSGVIILHDCNPPTIFHQREDYDYENSPAGTFWNGTTWKAFYKFRYSKNLYSICFDTDWGVGVISKTKYPEFNNLELPITNPYYEYNLLKDDRANMLNLHNFHLWEKSVNI